jgi:hypothetical protein
MPAGFGSQFTYFKPGYCGAAENGGDWSQPGEVTVDGFAFDNYNPGDVTPALCKAGCLMNKDCTGYSFSPSKIGGHHDCYLCTKTFPHHDDAKLNQYADYTTFKRVLMTKYPTKYPTKFPTAPKVGCKDWTCAEWCTKYDSKFDAQYALEGCNDDSEPCKCSK